MSGLPTLGGLIRQMKTAKLVNALFAGSTSGTATLLAPAVAGTTTITLPGATGTLATIAGTESLTNKTISGATNLISGAIYPDITKCSTQFDAVTSTTGSTLTNVVGLSQTVVAGTYKFRVVVSGTSTGNGGIKCAFKYTTTTLTSIEAMAKGYTASSIAVQHTTTATDQALLFDQKAAVIGIVIEGSMVVATGGTISFQAAQDTAHADTTSVYVGSTMEFVRIA